MELGFVAAGFLVAMLVALCGVGGGSLMTPLLVLGFGVPPAVAIGTDLLYVVAVKAAALAVYARRGEVEWRAAGAILRGSLPAVIASLMIVAWLGSTGALESVLNLALGAALALTAATLVFRERLQHRFAALAHTAAWTARRRGLLLSGFGALVGVLVTLSSIGAGALSMAILVMLLPGLCARRLVGTDLAQALPMGVVAGIGYLALGHVDAVLLGNLLLGTLPGVLAGGWLSGRLPEPVLRGGLAVLLAALALELATG